MDASQNLDPPLSVIAASFMGPALVPNRDVAWDEGLLPLNPDPLVADLLGQPLRRAGRFIKLVCCGAMACLKNAPPGLLARQRTGIFLATGLGNIDEILPFITQVFKHDGGFPSPLQFANSVSNAAAFFLARACDVKGVVLTLSQEEISFEAALWLAQSYLAAGEIDLALVGGCDVFTPTVEDYKERMSLADGQYRNVPMGETSSWVLVGRQAETKLGDILSVDLEDTHAGSAPDTSAGWLARCDAAIAPFTPVGGQTSSRVLLPGFRLASIDKLAWESSGWQIDDYLPGCGISPTASAYGLARFFLGGRSAIAVHANRQDSGRPALVVAVNHISP